ncbi:MAG: M56 family metallopeptidase [Bacteroidetes bacterium]|nr:M56 family metallopeptidase [Bacteroidota bacterium]
MDVNLFSERVLYAVCWTLLHSLWQALLLALITGLIMVISKKSSSTIRYNLLATIFLAFIITVCFTFYKEWKLSGINKLEVTTIATPDFHSHNTIQLQEKNMDASSILQNYSSIFINYFTTHASLIVTVWFIIFMAKCVKIFAGLVHIQRIRHYKINNAPEYWTKKISLLSKNLGIRKAVLLLESAIVKVPVVVGILKPVILVPVGLLANLPAEEIESILIHELAHIRRKDYFFNLLQCFVDVVFFFNPAVLWISSLIRNERENCCDDIAIQQTQNKKQFIQALVSFHQYNLSASKYAMPFAEKKSRLVNRVQRIVNDSNNTLNPAEKFGLIIGLFIFSAIFIGIAKAQSVPQKKQALQSKSVVSNKNIPSQKTNGQYQAAPTPSRKTNKALPEKKSLPVMEKEIEPQQENELQSVDNQWQSLGYNNISEEQLQQLKDHGVNAAFVEGFRRLGFKDISLDKALQLKDHGVSATFINDFYEIGFNTISLEKAQELKDHGVSPDYIKDLKELGADNISLDQAIELRDRGVSADFIKSFYQLGYKDISLEKAMQLRDHGVSPGFINEFRKLGFTDISLNKAQELRDHGINAAFVNEFRQAGFKDISLEKATQLRDHGVTTRFIEMIKKETGTELSLDEYIIMKDRR